MPKFKVYIKRTFDQEVIEKQFENLTAREVQAMRFEEQLLPGDLLVFDSWEMPPWGQRRTPMKRTEMKRSTTPIKPVSDKRKKENRERTKAMVEVRGRDQHACQLQAVIGTACHGPLHGHEILKRSRGGSITDPANIMLACDGHNGWVEDHPMLAEVYGLSLPSS